jgi:hypothetical protein
MPRIFVTGPRPARGRTTSASSVTPSWPRRTPSWVDLADHSRPVLAAARARGRTVWCDLHNYDGRSAFHTEFRDAADMLFVRSPDLAAPDAGGTGA